MKRKQMMISFGAYDDDVYEFLQNNKNASAFVRMLVRAYMRGENISPSNPTEIKVTPAPVVVEKVEEKVIESESKMEFDYSKCGTGNVDSNNNNRNMIKELEL